MPIPPPRPQHITPCRNTRMLAAREHQLFAASRSSAHQSPTFGSPVVANSRVDHLQRRRGSEVLAGSQWRRGKCGPFWGSASLSCEVEVQPGRMEVWR